MSNVIAFTPRPRPPEPAPSLPLAGIGLRANLEEAAQIALDAADRIIAALDLMDDADPALMAIAAHAGQVLQLRETPASVGTEPPPEPEPAQEEEPLASPEIPEGGPEEIAEPEPYAEPNRLPWCGTGNVVSAAGCAVLALMARA